MLSYLAFRQLLDNLSSLPVFARRRMWRIKKSLRICRTKGECISLSHTLKQGADMLLGRLRIMSLGVCCCTSSASTLSTKQANQKTASHRQTQSEFNDSLWFQYVATFYRWPPGLCLGDICPYFYAMPKTFYQASFSFNAPRKSMLQAEIVP